MKEWRKVSIEDAISLARSSQRKGRLEEAESVYTQILAQFPEQEEALHFLGILRYRQGRSEEAIELIQRAVAAAPGYADAYNNLGNVYKKTGRAHDAAKAYKKALTLNPNHTDACNNYGVMLRQVERPEEAEEAFRRCLELDPDHLSARRNIADLLRRNGRTREAAIHYRELLALDPDNPVLNYLVDVCEPGKKPRRAPDEYVRAEFDAFAPDFDGVLASLHYRAPQLIGELLQRRLAPPRGGLDLLDAGCGTGLCGPLLVPYARHLVGVDISENMLAEARKRGTYHDLVAGEITAYMDGNEGRFDLIASADTLCYFGALESVLSAAARALRPGGMLTFTAEQADKAGDSPGYALKPTGRYVHRRDYLHRTLEAAGLVPEQIDEVVLRDEGKKPVPGFLALALRGASSG